MSNIESNHKLFSGIMQKSRLEMPYSDFDDNVMLRIQQEQQYRESASKDGRLSLLFFLLGTGLGLVLNTFLSKLSGTYGGISSEKIILVFQISYILLIFTQLDTIIKLRDKLR